MKVWFVAPCCIAMLGTPQDARAQVEAAFKVGITKVDVSPQADRVPDGVRGILDHSFVGEIVLGNDKISGALITVATIGSATKPGPITAPEPTPAPM